MRRGWSNEDGEGGPIRGGVMRTGWVHDQELRRIHEQDPDVDLDTLPSHSTFFDSEINNFPKLSSYNQQFILHNILTSHTLNLHNLTKSLHNFLLRIKTFNQNIIKHLVILNLLFNPPHTPKSSESKIICSLLLFIIIAFLYDI